MNHHLLLLCIYVMHMLFPASLYAEGIRTGTVVHGENEQRYAEQVRLHDCVLSYDCEKHFFMPNRVTHVSAQIIPDYVHVGCGDISLDVSPDQLLYLQSTEQWVAARDIVCGDVLLSACVHGGVVVTDVTVVHKPIVVYRIGVEKPHSFCVTDAHIVVHNFLPAIGVGIALNISFGAGAVEVAWSVGAGFLALGSIIGFSACKKSSRESADHALSQMNQNLCSTASTTSAKKDISTSLEGGSHPVNGNSDRKEIFNPGPCCPQSIDVDTQYGCGTGSSFIPDKTFECGAGLLPENKTQPRECNWSKQQQCTGENFDESYAIDNGVSLNLVCSLNEQNLLKQPKKPWYTPPAEPVEEEHPHGIFVPAPYHHPNSEGRKSPGPKNGQWALDNSVAVDPKGNSKRRVGISEGEIVVLDKTSDGVYHGHVRTWDEIKHDKDSQKIKKVLEDNDLVTSKGKIKI